MQYGDTLSWLCVTLVSYAVWWHIIMIMCYIGKLCRFVAVDLAKLAYFVRFHVRWYYVLLMIMSVGIYFNFLCGCNHYSHEACYTLCIYIILCVEIAWLIHWFSIVSNTCLKEARSRVMKRAGIATGRFARRVLDQSAGPAGAVAHRTFTWKTQCVSRSQMVLAQTIWNYLHLNRPLTKVLR